MKEFFFMVIGICLCLAWCSVGADGYKFINENSDEIRLIKKLLDLESKIEAKINKKDGIVDGKDQRSTGDYENFPDAKRDEIVDGKDQRSIGDYENFPAAKRDEIVDGKDQRSTGDYENFPAEKKDEIVDGKDQRSTGDYENFPAAKKDEIVDGKDQRSTGDYENFPAAKKDEIVSSDVDGKDQRSTGDYENFPVAKKSNEPDYQNWYDDFNEKSKHGSKAINLKNRGQRNGNWKTQSKHGSKAINLKNQGQRNGNWKTQRKNGRSSSNSICENKAEPHQYTSINCMSLGTSTCGWRCCETTKKKRIINGTATVPNEFPWHASIFERSSVNDTFKYRCGGVLIKDDIVLTAGHCMEGYKRRFPSSQWEDPFTNSSNIRIFISLNNISTIVDYSRGYMIRELKFHQNYIRTDLRQQRRYDYALIRLNGRTNIEPVCMLFEDIRNISDERFNRCYAIGHGATNRVTRNLANVSPILQKVRISKFGQNANCFRANRTIFGHEIYLSDHWCAFGIEERAPGCHFDSGSPVVCPVNNDRCSPMFVAGILSTTEGLNCSASYTIMTKVHGARNTSYTPNSSADIVEFVCDND